MKTIFKILTAWLLVATFIFTGNSAEARSKKKSHHKKASVSKTHSKYKKKKSPGYAKASRYMKNSRKAASVSKKHKAKKHKSKKSKKRKIRY